MTKQVGDLARFFGKKVERIRKSRNINQDQLAEDSKTSPTTFSAIESGKQATNLNMVENIAKALKVSASFLLCDDQMNATPEDALELLRQVFCDQRDRIAELEREVDRLREGKESDQAIYERESQSSSGLPEQKKKV